MTAKDWNHKQVFVFGSNTAGRHGAGAARFAWNNCGAVWGIGRGRVAMSYAIPTKDEAIETLPLSEIQIYVNEFLDYAKENTDIDFQLTPIGCGLAGYTPVDIFPMFKDSPANVILPPEFLSVKSSIFAVEI